MREPIALQTVDLIKQYPGAVSPAINGLNLQVKRGEVYGYLGANGAGKTTTIRLILNFLLPTSGSAVVLGLDSVEDSLAIKRHIGYLAGDIALYSKASGRELLDYLGRLQGMKSQAYRHQLEDRFKADLSKPIAQLSKGNRQKIGIIQAFMHQPEVLILDEPSSGLDPLMQEAFFETVKEAKESGAGIFMSSHNLAEAQRICDRVGIIKSGQLIHEQPVKASGIANTIFRVSLVTLRDIDKLKSTIGLLFLKQVDDTTLLLQPTESISRALKLLGQFDIREFSSKALDLEEEFEEYYGGSHEADN